MAAFNTLGKLRLFQQILFLVPEIDTSDQGINLFKIQIQIFTIFPGKALNAWCCNGSCYVVHNRTIM